MSADDTKKILAELESIKADLRTIKLELMRERPRGMSPYPYYPYPVYPRPPWIWAKTQEGGDNE